MVKEQSSESVEEERIGRLGFDQVGEPAVGTVHCKAVKAAVQTEVSGFG